MDKATTRRRLSLALGGLVLVGAMVGGGLPRGAVRADTATGTSTGTASATGTVQATGTSQPTGTVQDTGTPQATATPAATAPPVPSGPRNVVKVENRTDGRLRADGRVQLNHIPGDTAAPLNEAYALSSCSGCQTFAVALQIDLISKTAHNIQPQNIAVALNVRCTGCTTVAKAYQVVLQVDDPARVPAGVHKLVAEMNRELNSLRGKNVTPSQAESDIAGVIGQFGDLSGSLQTERAQITKPNGKQRRTHHP